MSQSPILRFAPSPNGRLHLGHAYSALYTAHWARQLGGTFLLRIEDIDTIRSKPEFIEAIFEDLEWLGLSWPKPVWRQSDRSVAYAEALSQLDKLGLTYPCFCSRNQVAQATSHADPEGAPLYPGTCKHISWSERRRRLGAGEPANIRLDTKLAATQAGLLTYTAAQPNPDDRPQIQYVMSERWGDIVLARKDIGTSYHLSVVVDDAAQNITHVTRGRDLEAATDIHALLQLLLGLVGPIYTHHRLLTDESAQKLAKSRHSKTLKDLRDEGVSAKDIRTQLGFGD